MSRCRRNKSGRESLSFPQSELTPLTDVSVWWQLFLRRLLHLCGCPWDRVEVRLIINNHFFPLLGGGLRSLLLSFLRHLELPFGPPSWSLPVVPQTSRESIGQSLRDLCCLTYSMDSPRTLQILNARGRIGGQN